MNNPSQRKQLVPPPVSAVSSSVTSSSPQFTPTGMPPSSPFSTLSTSTFINNQTNNNHANFNNSVFVGDLSFFCTEVELASLFYHFGAVLSIEIKRGRHGDSLMHGFVEFVKSEDANRAIQEVNGIKFMGRKIRVNWANQKIPYNCEADSWIQVHVNFLTSNITMKVNEEFLENIFLSFGSLGDVVVKRHLSSPSQVTGYAFVYFYDIYAALRAIYAFRNNSNGASSYSENSVDNVYFECCLSYKSEQFLAENMPGMAGVIKRQQTSNPSAFFKQLEHPQLHLQQPSLQQPSLSQLPPSIQLPHLSETTFSQFSFLLPHPPQFQVPSHATQTHSFSRQNANTNVANANHHYYQSATAVSPAMKPAKSSLVHAMHLKPALQTSVYPNNNSVGQNNRNATVHVTTTTSMDHHMSSNSNFANIEGFQQHYYAKMGITNPSNVAAISATGNIASCDANAVFSNTPVPYIGSQSSSRDIPFASPTQTISNDTYASGTELKANLSFLLEQFYRPFSTANNPISNNQSQCHTTVTGSKTMDYFSPSNNSSSNSIQLTQNVPPFPVTSNMCHHSSSQNIVTRSAASSSVHPPRVSTTTEVTSSGANFESLFDV